MSGASKISDVVRISYLDLWTRGLSLIDELERNNSVSSSSLINFLCPVVSFQNVDKVRVVRVFMMQLQRWFEMVYADLNDDSRSLLFFMLRDQWNTICRNFN